MGFKGVRVDSRDIRDGSVTTPKLADGAVTSIKVAASLRSDNYVAGSTGWRIERDTGNVEFGAGVFRGRLIGAEFRTAETLTRIALGPNDVDPDSGAHSIKLFPNEAAEVYAPSYVFAYRPTASAGTARQRTSITSPRRLSTDAVTSLTLESDGTVADTDAFLVSRELFVTASGYTDLKATLHTGSVDLINDNGSTGAAWQMLNGAFHARNRVNSVWIPVRASAFEVQSDRSLKRNVRESRTKHLDIIANAPVREWEDGQGYTDCGPLLEDLTGMVGIRQAPIFNRERDERDEPVTSEDEAVGHDGMVSLTSLVGTLWGGVREMESRMTALERTVGR